MLQKFILTYLLVQIHLFILQIKFSDCKEIYVFNNGTDNISCGKVTTNPCQTIKYAVKLSNEGDRVLVDSSKGTYNQESGFYVDLKYNISIIGINGRNAVINCSCIDSKLFNVSSMDFRLTLEIKQITFLNCQNINYSAIILNNAKLVLFNVNILNSGAFISNSEITNITSCKTIEVTILNSTLKNNYFTNPYYNYAIALNCAIVKLSITNSNVTSSPLLTKAAVISVININNVQFKDVGNGLNALFFHLSEANNIVITDSSFINFITFYNSPITLSAYKINSSNMTGMNSILLSRLLFLDNRCKKSSGGAISILSKNINSMVGVIKLTDSQFIRCSAKLYGGAIFALLISNFKINNCTFLNNTAVNGGALYLKQVNVFSAFNSTFIANKAISGLDFATRGGAIYLEAVSSQLSYGFFTDNFATYDGDAIYADKCPSISIMNITFSSKASPFKMTPRKTLLTLITDKSLNRCTTSINKCVFKVQNYATENSVIFADGNIDFKNSSIYCSTETKINCQIIKPTYSSSYYSYNILNLWCAKTMSSKIKNGCVLK